jgi:flagellar basal-body rod modification protein FlgD
MSTTTESSSVAGIAGIAAAPTTKHKTTADLNVNDFMRLMTTQLQNQDPLKPLDSTDFVAQLAQFGTVSGVQGMQGSLAALSSALQSSQMLTGASLVGHRIQTAADSLRFDGSTAVGGLIRVPEDQDRVQLTIADASGQAVRHIELRGEQGDYAFEWDGKGDDGARMPAGQYRLQAVGSIGQSHESLSLWLNGRVRSVSLDASGGGLTINTNELGAVALGAVREVI